MECKVCLNDAVAVCGECREVAYCGEECQRVDWFNGHNCLIEGDGIDIFKARLQRNSSLKKQGREEYKAGQKQQAMDNASVPGRILLNPMRAGQKKLHEVKAVKAGKRADKKQAKIDNIKRKRKVKKQLVKAQRSKARQQRKLKKK